ncbi:alpha/beta hydrolase [Qipengyuania sediminis]|uniref:alpha/beta hydrolase n=1 Tax=Qipengyuania sediminis TaxID=1532023 RepID=UPI001F0F7AF6|nr:alpha/beta hydrolase [Qipengyuania sediminis]
MHRRAFNSATLGLLASAALLAGCMTMGRSGHDDHMGADTRAAAGGYPLAASEPAGQPGIAASGMRPVARNQAVIDALLRDLKLRPYHTLEPKYARQQPSFTDGVMRAMANLGQPMPPPTDVTERAIQVGGAAGMLNARMFMPAGASGPLPVIVYFHGGGWVIANPDVYAPSARALAREARAIVVSVDYRKAPEYKFPAQHDDALAAYRWVAANAASLGGDPARLALAGESAGGNLAVATAMAARTAGLTQPRHVLSIYPIAGTDMTTESYRENANAMPLNRALMAWFMHHTLASPAQALDPRLNLFQADLSGLPPVTIVAAQIDPLTSEGELLTTRLRQLRVPVERREFPGVTHEFFGAAPLIPAATEAQKWAGGRLRTALAR